MRLQTFVITNTMKDPNGNAYISLKKSLYKSLYVAVSIGVNRKRAEKNL